MPEPPRRRPTPPGSTGPGVSSRVASTRPCGRSPPSEGRPYTVVSGEGAFVVDVEGTRYLDMVQSYGAVLLGHAHPVVTGAITAAAARGTTFGAPTPGEVLLAEAICDARAGLRTGAPRLFRDRGRHERRAPRPRRDRAATA